MQVDRLAVHRGLRLLGAGEEQHAVDHPRQPLVLLLVGGQQVLVVLDRAGVAQGLLGVPHQVAQRRAHLVGEILGEARQLGEAVLQARQHLVQRRAQAAQLADLPDLVEAQVQVLHVDGPRPRRQLTQRAQAAQADQPTEQEGQQRPGGQRQPEFQPVGGEHLAALGEQLAGDQGQAAALVLDVQPGQPRRLGRQGVAQLHRRPARQLRHGQCGGVDLDQHLPVVADDPQQAVAIAQHVGVQLRPLAQRLDARAVVEQRAHAFQAPEQGLVVAPGDFPLQRLVQVEADGAEQQHADQGEQQRQAQAQRARPQAHGCTSST
ncbi:hypothetical protein D3C81_1242160 [compost metagenome]